MITVTTRGRILHEWGRDASRGRARVLCRRLSRRRETRMIARWEDKSGVVHWGLVLVLMLLLVPAEAVDDDSSASGNAIHVRTCECSRSSSSTGCRDRDDVRRCATAVVMMMMIMIIIITSSMLLRWRIIKVLEWRRWRGDSRTLGKVDNFQSRACSVR